MNKPWRKGLLSNLFVMFYRGSNMGRNGLFLGYEGGINRGFMDRSVAFMSCMDMF
jgi:hypothetical protein